MRPRRGGAALTTAVCVLVLGAISTAAATRMLGMPHFRPLCPLRWERMWSRDSDVSICLPQGFVPDQRRSRGWERLQTDSLRRDTARVVIQLGGGLFERPRSGKTCVQNCPRFVVSTDSGEQWNGFPAVIRRGRVISDVVPGWELYSLDVSWKIDDTHPMEATTLVDKVGDLDLVKRALRTVWYEEPKRPSRESVTDCATSDPYDGEAPPGCGHNGGYTLSGGKRGAS